MKSVIPAMLVVLAACKEPGTITVDMALPDDLGYCGGQPAEPYLLVYAQPKTSCDRCGCGECFGAQPGSVGSRLGCTADDPCEGALDVDLDLDPGHWAIVVSLWDGESDRLVASECAEIDIAADGVTSKRVAGGAITCLDTCPTVP